MNILELEDTLKGIPDEVLMQEAQQPSGSAPQYLVISEIQRRSDMRERYASEQEQPQNTVSDQIVNKGIASLGGSSAPSPSMNMQQPMAAAQPMTPPMTQQMMPEQPMAPTQMMNVGGEVMLDEAEDVTMLLDELGSSMNKIPENRERDLLMSDFSSSVLSDIPLHSQGLASNALREDASKFNPEQMMGADINELFAVQNVDSDLPEILNYAGGGIVELKNGGEVPEEEGLSWRSFVPDWVEENPWEAASYASLLIPGLGVGGLALRGIGAAGRAALGARTLSRAGSAVKGAGRIPQWMFTNPRAARTVLNQKGNPVDITSRAGQNILKKNPAARISRAGDQLLTAGGKKATTAAEAGRELAPWKALTSATGIGQAATGIGGAYFGDDADDADAAEAQMPDIDLGDYGEADNGIIGAGLENEGPEPGSLEFVQQELADMYKSGGEDRQAKLDEILGRQREESELTKEQTRSDMVTSALMNLGAGIAAGDPSEGLRLAANAVDGIRSAARQGVAEQQRYTDELELAGMDVNQAERAAVLSSMADAERLKQSGLQLNNQAVTTAFKVIDQAVEALSARSMQTGNVITQVDIYERTAAAYRLALQDPMNQNAYMSVLMKPSDGNNNFDISED